jgi:triosephosphate isomerase
MKPLIIANWKMNPVSLEEAKEIFSVLGGPASGWDKSSVEVVICPPFAWLAEGHQQATEGGFTLGAQNVFYEEKGAFTGEVSGEMLKNLGIEYVIIGHSERRKNFGETDEIVNKKIKKALEAGLKIIFCIGETEEERKAGKKNEVLQRQIQEGLKDVIDIKDVNVAYEPVWAISNGDPYKTKELPTTEEVKEMSDYIRKFVKPDTRIIYGGSVNSENAIGYLKDAGMQGLLVGGASLDAEEFVKIVKSAE